jgi:hypothetical protein
MMLPIPELVFRPLRPLASIPDALLECVLSSLLEENSRPATPWYFGIVAGEIGITAEEYRLDALSQEAQAYLEAVIQRCSQP